MHTPKEIKQITDAWAHLLYWSDQKRGLKKEIEDAMRSDKAGRTTFTTTRAMIMDFALYIEQQNPTLQQVKTQDMDIIRGGLSAYNALCCSLSSGSTEDHAELLSLMSGAVLAHNQALNRKHEQEIH
jgi:hypothetical protein